MARYKLISEINATEGWPSVLQYVRDVTGGLFFNLILIGIFFVLTFSMYKKQQDWPASMTVALFVTSIIAGIFRIAGGLISDITLGIWIALFVGAGIWLWFTREG